MFEESERDGLAAALSCQYTLGLCNAPSENHRTEYKEQESDL